MPHLKVVVVTRLSGDAMRLRAGRRTEVTYAVPVRKQTTIEGSASHHPLALQSPSSDTARKLPGTAPLVWAARRYAAWQKRRSGHRAPSPGASRCGDRAHCTSLMGWHERGALSVASTYGVPHREGTQLTCAASRRQLTHGVRGRRALAASASWHIPVPCPSVKNGAVALTRRHGAAERRCHTR
jgi:hypothetical protein